VSVAQAESTLAVAAFTSGSSCSCAGELLGAGELVVTMRPSALLTVCCAMAAIDDGESKQRATIVRAENRVGRIVRSSCQVDSRIWPRMFWPPAFATQIHNRNPMASQYG
jgi:hypothetical protein